MRPGFTRVVMERFTANYELRKNTYQLSVAEKHSLSATTPRRHGAISRRSVERVVAESLGYCATGIWYVFSLSCSYYSVSATDAFGLRVRFGPEESSPSAAVLRGRRGRDGLFAFTGSSASEPSVDEDSGASCSAAGFGSESPELETTPTENRSAGISPRFPPMAPLPRGTDPARAGVAVGPGIFVSGAFFASCSVTGGAAEARSTS